MGMNLIPSTNVRAFPAALETNTSRNDGPLAIGDDISGRLALADVNDVLWDIILEDFDADGQVAKRFDCTVAPQGEPLAVMVASDTVSTI